MAGASCARRGAYETSTHDGRIAAIYQRWTDPLPALGSADSLLQRQAVPDRT
jgi:hypothetical protein